MPTPVETTLAALLAAATAALGAYGFTLYVKGNPVTQSIEPANVKTFVLTKGQTLTNTYQGRLLDITKKSNLSSIVQPISENREWWEWAFKFKFEKYKSTINLDPLFSSISLAFSSTDSKALNKACEIAYQKEKSKFNAEDNAYVLNVGAFCTTGSEFLDISEPNALVYEESNIPQGYEKGVLKEQKNRDKLVRTRVLDGENNNFNDLWWEWAFKHLLTERARKTANDLFKNLTVAYKKETENSSSITSLNNACDETYKKIYKDLRGTTTEPVKIPLLNDIRNFCSTVYTSSGIVFPTPDSPHLVGDNTSFDGTYTPTNSVVKTGENKKKLVDPDKPENENWWIWTLDRFLPYAHVQTTKQHLIDPFDKVTVGYSGTAGTPLALNQACKTAYSKVKNNFSTTPKGKTPLIQQIKDFCSILDSKESLEIP